MALMGAVNEPLLLLLLILLFSVTCHGNQNQQFINSCGDIHNISFPFQLQGHPSHTCSYDQDYFTLSCDENNRTVLNLFSGKYYVKSINYTGNTIRLVDEGIQTNDICSSFPLNSLTPHDFYSVRAPYWVLDGSSVMFLRCEKPVQSPKYINRTAYCNTTRDYAGNGYYSYVVVGGVTFWDVADSCTVEVVYMSSSQVISERGSNLSWLDVNRELGYGFEFSYVGFGSCKRCEKRASCFRDSVNVTAVCQRRLPQDICHTAILESGYPFSLVLKSIGYVYLLFLRVLQIIGYPFSLVLKSIEYVRRHPLLLSVLQIIVGVFAARILCVPCVFGFLIYKFSRRHLSMFDTIEEFLQSQNHLVPIRYSYSDIKKMTNGFRDKLGEGGYGFVYKGKLRSGLLVAVKMLSKPKAHGQEFINEVATIGRIHHVNVVHLIGYCAERSKRALVYEFMPNGSLDKYIFSPEGNLSVSHKQMYEISLGVARGIGYLHQGCDMQILHFDIKPHNILLDENLTPKVSDFGLAKLYPSNDSTVTVTAARGTLGYMAPELFYKNIGGVSYKADVYSFGMLLMEIAGRRRNWISLANSSQNFFPSWVYDQFVEGRNVQIGEISEEESEMVKKMMLVALWCIQMKPSDRPSMNEVVEMLEGNIELLHMPPRPFLYPQAMTAENNGMNIRSSNLSGACLDSITRDLSGR